MGLEQVRQRYRLQQEGKLSQTEEQTMREEAAQRLQNLPPVARKLFEKRRDELLRTGELEKLKSGSPDSAVGGEPLSVSTKIDLIVFFIGFLVLGGALYTEYKINVFTALYGYVVSLLDPGVDPARRT